MDAVGSWSIIFAVIKFIVCFFGILLNGLVILTICKNIRYLSASSYLILSISVSDFLSCAVAVPFSMAIHFKKEWPLGMAGCQAHAFMIFLLALVSITHLAAISVGKYLTITRSLSRESYFNKKKVLMIILASWMYSLVFSAPPLMGWSRYGLEGTNETCSIKWKSSSPGDRAYFVVIFIACYFLPMAVISFCYYKIYQVSKQIVGNTSQMGGLAMTMTQALTKKHRESAMYFLIVIATFMLSWSPYAIVSLLLIVRGYLNPIATSACSVFAKTSFFLNPILYAMISRKFRRRVILAIPITKANREIRQKPLRLDSAVIAL
ncbi:melanopsin-B-like [Oculina patagonica]